MTNCKLCGIKLTPKRKKFCSNSHKDKYHNKVNPRGFYSPSGRKLNTDSNWNFDSMDGNFNNEDN